MAACLSRQIITAKYRIKLNDISDSNIWHSEKSKLHSLYILLTSKKTVIG